MWGNVSERSASLVPFLLPVFQRRAQYITSHVFFRHVIFLSLSRSRVHFSTLCKRCFDHWDVTEVTLSINSKARILTVLEASSSLLRAMPSRKRDCLEATMLWASQAMQRDPGRWGSTWKRPQSTKARGMRVRTLSRKWVIWPQTAQEMPWWSQKNHVAEPIPTTKSQ